MHHASNFCISNASVSLATVFLHSPLPSQLFAKSVHCIFYLQRHKQLSCCQTELFGCRWILCHNPASTKPRYSLPPVCVLAGRVLAAVCVCIGVNLLFCLCDLAANEERQFPFLPSSLTLCSLGGARQGQVPFILRQTFFFLLLASYFSIFLYGLCGLIFHFYRSTSIRVALMLKQDKISVWNSPR